ncbi:MAG: hypothetical protein IKZ24_02620, partial [Burkholderiaceae bacterium]|nr:hypothetical protein [Burkholderiaceae bacterium]
MATASFALRKKGEKLAPQSERLARLGLTRDWDFVLHLPLRYEDETAITSIARLVPGEAQQCECEVIRCDDVRRQQGNQLQV